MTGAQHFTSVRFHNYKALKNFSVQLRRFNVLVGPNNSGKSTILGAFRILAEGMRRARARKPEPIHIGNAANVGYRIILENLPISTENVFTNYDEGDPAKIDFSLSDGSRLQLVFPEVGVCYLVCDPKGRPVRTPANFKSSYTATIGFVPVLGPVEHDEQLYKPEAAREALLTHRASRNFRNIWHHFPARFDEFRRLIQQTWPGMDIEPPEIERGASKPMLRMFCPEERYAREIYWAGFGFQVWCQMLTYVIGAREDSLLVIDEPDIYLHSDLQRQLLSILYELGPDILLATHSTEIITEAEPGDLLIVNKKARSAKRIVDPKGLQELFELLGSNLNPTLTQLAKSRRALFVEGRDFQILGAFARKIGRTEVAARADFAVIPVEGFNPTRIEQYSKGIELTLGASVLKAVVLDRDYRTEAQIQELKDALAETTSFSHIHDRKEIENYLLEPAPLERAIRTRLFEQNARTGRNMDLKQGIEDALIQITDSIKQEILGLYISCYVEGQKAITRGVDESTLTTDAVKKFDESWGNLSSRLSLVPGKRVLALLNAQLQGAYGISLSPLFVIGRFKKDEVPTAIQALVDGLENFRKKTP